MNPDISVIETSKSPDLLSFYGTSEHPVARIFLDDGKLCFEGDMDTATKSLFETVCKLVDGRNAHNK